MTNSLFEAVVHATRVLTKYGLTVEELAAVVEQNDMSDAEVLAVSKVFDCLLTKQEISTVNFMLRTSRLTHPAGQHHPARHAPHPPPPQEGAPDY